MLIGRFAPPSNLPWLPRPTGRDRARRAVGMAVGALPLAAAIGIDFLLARLPSRPGQSNAYRVLARAPSARSEPSETSETSAA
jgi:hypothetical protein